MVQQNHDFFVSFRNEVVEGGSDKLDNLALHLWDIFRAKCSDSIIDHSLCIHTQVLQTQSLIVSNFDRLES